MMGAITVTTSTWINPCQLPSSVKWDNIHSFLLWTSKERMFMKVHRYNVVDFLLTDIWILWLFLLHIVSSNTGTRIQAYLQSHRGETELDDSQTPHPRTVFNSIKFSPFDSKEGMNQTWNIASPLACSPLLKQQEISPLSFYSKSVKHHYFIYQRVKSSVIVLLRFPKCECYSFSWNAYNLFGSSCIFSFDFYFEMDFQV